MRTMRVQLWLGTVVLFIAFLDSFGACSKTVDNPNMGITEMSFSRGHGRRRIREGNVVSGTRVLSCTRRLADLPANSSQFTSTAEADVLLDFRNGITNDPHDVLSGWNSSNKSDYCSWIGVICNNTIGKVSSLNLSGQHLAGSISPSLGGLQFLSSLDLSNNSFEGTIPTGISNISSLTVLDLAGNLLTGSIPVELQLLLNIQELYLGRNDFTGALPSFLSNFSALRVLDLGVNRLSGDMINLEWDRLLQLETLVLEKNEISGVIPDSLTNFSRLVHLDLSVNQLSGDIVNVTFGKLQKLQYFSAQNNSLTGSIPVSLASLSSLQYLSLSVNQLSGMIPSQLGLLGGLKTLGLSDNHLTGPIPPTFAQLANLKGLSLGDNVLTGVIPPFLGSLKALARLDLSSNQLSGSIPPELGNLPNLEFLNLSNNSLVGSIPASLSNCSSFRGLFLYMNHLSGEIFNEVGMLSQLQHLYLWQNNLTGIIPATLANCTSLSYLILSYNQLSGEIPQALGMRTKMQYLYLHFNNFFGHIPASLGNCSTLEELVLDQNLLSGEIPPELGNLRNLSKLDLTGNLLTGMIPASLGNASALLSLSLPKNQLSGQIPSSIGRLTYLQGLNLSDNILSGGIPPDLSSCTQLYKLDLSGNLLTGTIPNQLSLLVNLNWLYLNNNYLTGLMSSALNQVQVLNLLDLSLAHNSFNGVIAGYNFQVLRRLQIGLDLSHNLLSGPLPAGIGALDSVQKIDLSFNSFSGVITDAFSECKGLQSLDLSANDLGGEIPPSLASLPYLTYFNVSFNELTGPVPDSGQFANFSDGSFLGNPGLCGPMLPRNCSTVLGQHPGSGKSCHGGLCHRMWILIVPVVGAAIAAFFVVAACWFLFVAKPSDQTAIVVPVLPPVSHFTSDFQDLSIGDIMAATNGFSDSNIVGVGRKSTVYAGVLPAGVIIAVKTLALENDDKATFELHRELQRLSKLDHPNLLKVHGLFSTGDMKALILEHMANGSLRKQLYEGETCRLTWAQRLDIALGVAEAMVHLHHAASKPILHLDLKPSNILLGKNMEPKVADYGISRFLNHESHGDVSISSNLYGTIGYIPPEYGAMTSVSPKGDIYNYGVVLMELFTRKQPTDDMFGQEVSLRSWVVSAFPGRISVILDSTLRQELVQAEQELGIHLMVRLAVACTRNAPKDRPTMIEARDMLMEIKSIEQPYKAYPTIEQR